MSEVRTDRVATRHLESWGEVEWSRLLEAAARMTCAWADYAGFHIGPCPEEAPPYSHIWGWSTDGRTLLRGRIEGGRVTVGWLLDQPGGDKETQEVDCVVRDLLTWRPGHQRLKIRPQGLEIPEKMHAVEVLGPNPVTFVSS